MENETSKFYTDTASSVSAFQYPPDLLLFLLRALEKDEEKKASYTCTVAFFSVFGLLWTIGQNEKKYDALSNENALVQTGGKVQNYYFGGEIILLLFLQIEIGEF